jgi:hypothetical protein
VLIDDSHRKWISATLFILLVSTVLYIPYALYAPNGPTGGSWPGLIYGIVGYGFMLYAGLLMGRKKKPIWRIGRAQTWMRGHLWLGLLSLPLILFHAGFEFGGRLTWTLMVLFILVWLSGIFGALVQHFVPRLMTTEVPMETIYEQIETVRHKLRSEADEIMEAMCGTVAESKKAVAVAAGPSLTGTVMMMAPVGAAGTPVREVDEGAAKRLREFYDNEVAPFLDAPAVGGSQLAEKKRAEAVFRQMRTLLPASFHDAIDDLEDICEEERELNRQARLHHWMHTWLLAHIPLSLALLLLSAVHAVMALAY